MHIQRYQSANREVNYWFAQALKQYFDALYRLAGGFEMSELPHATCDVDFIARVPREKVTEVSDKLLDVAYDINRRYAVHLSTMVLPLDEPDSL